MDEGCEEEDTAGSDTGPESSLLSPLLSCAATLIFFFFPLLRFAGDFVPKA